MKRSEIRENPGFRPIGLHPGYKSFYTGSKIPGQKKYLCLTVSDNGRGIPLGKKEWIFLPLSTTAQGDEGSGLGLFSIRRTLKEMRGFIRETGQHGAYFEIYIPYPTGDA